MGIDPSNDRLEPFYIRMRQLGMILLSHTGRERALEAGDQDFGNPLLLRKPLDLGVRVVALHSACDGSSEAKTVVQAVRSILRSILRHNRNFTAVFSSGTKRP